MTNLIKATRATLKLSQVEFGVWLQQQMKLEKPIVAQRISEYELGIRSPRRAMRDICMPIVAKALANDAVAEVAKCFGKDVTNDNLTPDLLTARDDIKEWIEQIS